MLALSPKYPPACSFIQVLQLRSHFQPRPRGLTRSPRNHVHPRNNAALRRQTHDNTNTTATKSHPLEETRLRHRIDGTLPLSLRSPTPTMSSNSPDNNKTEVGEHAPRNGPSRMRCSN